MTHTCENQQGSDGFGPDCPAPTPQQKEPCTGTITGTVQMECCCPRLYTRTFALLLPPDFAANIQGTIQSTVNNYESNGYLVLAHSLTDSGGGWLLGLTIGWYAP